MKKIKIFDIPLTKEQRIEEAINISNMPVRYHLIDVLEIIKSGRPADNQEFLDEMIQQLKDNPERGVPF